MAIQAADQLRIPLTSIEVSPHNPRTDVGDLTDLIASIKDLGVLEPIVVIERDGKYQAITGSRRLAASKKAGVKDVPARIMQFDEAQAAAAALVENLHRKDLNPIEEAQGYRDYLALTGKTQKELAAAVGRVPSTIANALRLLEAPKPVKEAIQSGVIGAAHGLEMLRLKDPGLAQSVLDTAIKSAKQDDGPKISALPLRVLTDVVERANVQTHHVEWVKTAKERLLRRKAELEKDGYTVTWAPMADHLYRDDADYQVEKYLGKPPAVKIALAGYELEAWKTHAKDCGCKAVALTISRAGWNQQKDGNVETADVCIDSAAARKYRGSRSAAYGGRPKPTKEQVEKQKRDQVVEALDHRDFREADLTPKNAAAVKKLTKKDLGTEIARLVLFAMTDERWWGGRERLMLWQAIEAMPLAKVKARVVALSVSKVFPFVTRKHHVPEKNLPHHEPMLAKFHLTLADADLLPKLPLDKKPAPPAKGKPAATKSKTKAKPAKKAKR